MFFKLSLFFLFFISLLADSSIKEIKPHIYSHHWWGALPHSENLLVHDIFIISFDSEKNFPDWVAYHLSPALVWGQLKAERKYKKDPLLSSPLTYKDYAGASNCDGKLKGRGYHKGHLAPLGSFKGSAFSYQAQYLSNIVPQKRNLNQGPWRILEEKIRAFVKKGKEVKILTGPLYETSLAPCWKAAQGKITQIPSSFWKLITFKDKSRIKICGFVMPQEVSIRSKPKKYIQSLSDISSQTGLSFFQNHKAEKIKESCSFLSL